MRALWASVLLGVTVVSLCPALAASPRNRRAASLSPPALASLSLSPPSLQAVSTGSGKITLYWTAVPGAAQYFVYRGARSLREDTRRAVNLGQPLRPSFDGSRWFMLVDTDRGRGLKNGHEYYYRVKAVAPDGRWSLSPEDSDVVDPNAIPWDSREPKLIITAVCHIAQPDEGDPLQGGMTVAGPDNYLYEYDPRTGSYTGRPNPWIVTDNVADNRETGESIVLSSGASGGTFVRP